MPKLPALPFVRTGLSQGWSANQAYREYQSTAREADATAGRRQDFLRLYSQTRELRTRTTAALDAPKDQIPGRDLIVERDTQIAQGYGTWVSIFQRTRGESDFMSMPYLIKSSTPITPQEAENLALDYLTRQPDQYNRTTLGVAYMGTERFNPRP